MRIFLGVVIGSLVLAGNALAASGLVLTPDGLDRFGSSHIHRAVAVTNPTGQTISVYFEVKIGKTLLSTSFPRPSYLTVAPGETQQIIVSTLASELSATSGTFDQPVVVDVYDSRGGSLLDELVLHSQVTLERPSPNATLTGRIVANGKPLAGIPVRVSSTIATAQVKTNARGVYTARVSSAAETSVRALPPAKLRLQSRGVVVRPKPGANAVGTVTLPARRERASYRLVASGDTVLAAYHGAADATGSLFATTPFHQSVDAALNVFDGGANKLWSHSLLAPGGTGASGALDVSRDGALIATGFVHGEVRVLDRAGAVLWELAVPGDRTGGGSQIIAQTLKFSPDGRRLFVGTGDGRWLLYDVGSRSVVWQGQAGINNVGLEALFSSDGSRIYVGDGDGYVRAFDTVTGGVLWQRWVGGVSYAMALGGGKLVVSGKSGFSTFALDASTGAVAWSYPQDFQVNNIALSPDGSRAYLAAPDGGGVQCGAVESGHAVWDLGQPCTSVAVDGGGKHVLVAGATFAAVLSSDGDVLWQATLAGKPQFPNAKGFAWISPDAKRLFVANEATGRVYAFAGGVG